jgi:hypothetical protein
MKDCKITIVDEDISLVRNAIAYMANEHARVGKPDDAKRLRKYADKLSVVVQELNKGGVS